MAENTAPETPDTTQTPATPPDLAAAKPEEVATGPLCKICKSPLIVYTAEDLPGREPRRGTGHCNTCGKRYPLKG